MSSLEVTALPRAGFRRLISRMFDAAAASDHEPREPAWVESVLSPAEFALWRSMTAIERTHSVRVARGVQRRLAGSIHADDRRWLAVALLHDIGKTDTVESLHERAIAAVAGRVVGIDTARRWSEARRGFTRRVGRFLQHGHLGAMAIRKAGGREEAANWAEMHQMEFHRDAGKGGIGVAGIPHGVVIALAEADGD